MSRLTTLFSNKQQNILNIYCTAGYPKLNDTLAIMESLQKSGADIIELGMPYSDPLADGETIQNSSNVAIANGMTVATLFEQLQQMRRQVGETMPVVLMGYMNSVLRYGFEKFCADAAKVGIDGLILPDLPAHEFESTYKAILEKYNLNLVFLVTPETSEERVRYLDGLSSGFLYAVSSSSTTGNEKNFDEVIAYLQKLQSYQLKNKVLVGFGISDKASFNAVSKHANGAIIGSAFIKALQQDSDVTVATSRFVNSILH